MDEFFKQGLIPARGKDAPPMGIFPTSPSSPSQIIRYRIGFVVKSKVPVQPPLRITSITLPSATKYTHRGRFERLFDVHSKLDKSLRQLGKKKGTGPVVQLYLDNPEKVGLDQARTEIVVPVTQ